LWEAKAKGPSPGHPFAKKQQKKSTYAYRFPKTSPKSDRACHLPRLIARLCRSVLKGFLGCGWLGGRQQFRLEKIYSK